ncbi:hypothetical protein GGE65_001928 [Skermanella aerolata]
MTSVRKVDASILKRPGGSPAAGIGAGPGADASYGMTR